MYRRVMMLVSKAVKSICVSPVCLSDKAHGHCALWAVVSAVGQHATAILVTVKRYQLYFCLSLGFMTKGCDHFNDSRKQARIGNVQHYYFTITFPLLKADL